MTECNTEVCCDGRTVRSLPSESLPSAGLFKYLIKERNESFMSCMTKPQLAYDVYLEWIVTYHTPDGVTVHRCFTDETDAMHQYVVQETGEVFYSVYENIYTAYTDPYKNYYQ